MKPDYSAAATELKGQGILAAIDVNRPENAAVRKFYNITGFPTLLYFEYVEVSLTVVTNRSLHSFRFLTEMEP